MRLVVVAAAVLIAFAADARAGRDKPVVTADQIVRIKAIPKAITAPVKRQLARLRKMKDPHQTLRVSNGGLTAGTWAGSPFDHPFRDASIQLSGKESSVTTDARDGQFFYERVYTDGDGTLTSIREHQFRVSPRNRALIAEGFEAGEKVTVTTKTLLDRDSWSKHAKALRNGGAAKLEVFLGSGSGPQQSSPNK